VINEGPPAADPLYGAAREIAAAHGRVSLSMIQRRLHIGYSRAKRLAEAVAAA
jgi:DNA segregation ATPase FtsK/SpoIIIE-like protein